MRFRFSLPLLALMAWVLAQPLPGLHSRHVPPNDAPAVAHPPQAEAPPTLPASLADMELRLDDLVYRLGDAISATLDLGNRPLATDSPPAVLLTSPDSGDVEILPLAATKGGALYRGTAPIPTALPVEHDPVRLYDGTLSVMPGEMFHAVWLVDGLAHPDAAQPALLSDYGIVQDDAAYATHPVDLVPELAHWDDTPAMPAMAKPFGTLLSRSGVPLQAALNELIAAPRSADELEDILARTQGRIVRTDVLPDDPAGHSPRYYLIEVDTSGVDIGDLPTLRRLTGQHGFVAADS